ncbi:MAG TPA: adenine deaminase [Firmicutes bacterium]|nr:adenine deaminase [Bacillota bacterium]
MNKENFIEQIKASTKEIPCDLVIKNITIIDVFQTDSYIGDIGIKNGYIVGIGDYDGLEVVDGTNKYICPGLIDAHAHIESSLVTPDEYCKTGLKNGITSMVIDPHEIANVLGTKGIELMLELSEGVPLDYYFMLPSCVPATVFESSGATLKSADLAPFYEHPRVLGLAEVMNYPEVISTAPDMMSKLYDALANDKMIDGHGAGFNGDLLNAYATARITTDHECHSPSEVIERLRRGIYVLIREGTVAKNLKELITATSILNSRRVCLCTDDKHIDDLIENGSINSSIVEIMTYGHRPETAIQMATINTAECYQLKQKGAIAPGYVADFLILEDLRSFKIESVYKAGTKVVHQGEILYDSVKKEIDLPCHNSIQIPELSPSCLNIQTRGYTTLNVINIIPNKLESTHLKYDLSSYAHDCFVPDCDEDLAKVAVIERHHLTGNIGLGVLKGLELRGGAIATTIAHDSHNLIVAGMNDADMMFAATEIKKMQGGIIVVKDQQVLASIQLEIGGLMTKRCTEDVLIELDKLHDAIYELSPSITFNPFLTLSFLSLPVIPDLKITDKGLFDVTKFEFISVVE